MNGRLFVCVVRDASRQDGADLLEIRAIACEKVDGLEKRERRVFRIVRTKRVRDRVNFYYGRKVGVREGGV